MKFFEKFCSETVFYRSVKRALRHFFVSVRLYLSITLNNLLALVAMEVIINSNNFEGEFSQKDRGKDDYLFLGNTTS